MISTKTLIQKANELIQSGELTELQIAQLSTIEQLGDRSVAVVNTVNDLPAPGNNAGKLVYVIELEKYVFSVGYAWTDNFGESNSILASVWGSNSSGQLGDDTTDNRSSPVSVIGGITNWKSISAGRAHTAAATKDGIAYAWGSNDAGQLGDGTTISRTSPVTVIGGITNWSQISAGNFHTAAVTDDGIAYAWGVNGQGRLGDGTITSRTSPVTVIGGITNWKQISAGGGHTAAVTDDGIAYTWGSNLSFRLGQGVSTFTSRSSPATVIGGITNWKQISAADEHTAAVTDDGIAYAWGNNFNGQIGNGTTITQSSPVSVIGGITNWKQISAGNQHTAAVTDDGIAYAWGLNTARSISEHHGQLGDGTEINRSSPVTVVGGITNWKQISAGGFHTAAVTDDGIAYAWGKNSFGQLGQGVSTYISRSSPVTVVGGITNWKQISASYHTAAIYLGKALST